MNQKKRVVLTVCAAAAIVSLVPFRSLPSATMVKGQEMATALPEVTPDADIISICMSLPHTTGSLYRMLIRFALYGLNITKIESAPVPQAKQDIKRETFDVVFYLDFEGNALDPEVVRLMTIL